MLLTGLLGCHSAADVSIEDGPRNVLFILVDDLGAKDLGVEGSTFYETPNVDALAQKGFRFDRGYSASRVCSPSRASILTGKYVTGHGVTTWIGDKHGAEWRTRNRHDSHDPADYAHSLGKQEVTLAEAFKTAGYATFFAGKWHLGGEGSGPEDHGFDINKGGWDVGTPKGGYFSPYNNPKLQDGPEGESLTIRLANETAAFIDQQRSGEPFFAFLSFYAVHAPIQTTEDLWKKYRDKAVEQTKDGVRFKFDRRYAVRLKQDHPVFGGLVETMDTAVGIVLNKLRETGLDDNTIVVFTSDNGGLSSGDGHGTSVLPLRGGKGRQFEGGIRVPYYVYVPRATNSGADIDVPVSGVDFYPTLLELTGLKIPGNHRVDGRSLVPLLKGERIANRALYWHYPHYGNQGGEPSSMIMEGKWKLILYHEDDSVELYDVVKDIGEQKDVFELQKEKAAALKAKLDQWLAGTNAKFPTANPEFDEDQRAERWEDLRADGLTNLEKLHDLYLDADYDPGNAWWGSKID